MHPMFEIEFFYHTPYFFSLLSFDDIILWSYVFVQGESFYSCHIGILILSSLLLLFFLYPDFFVNDKGRERLWNILVLIKLHCFSPWYMNFLVREFYILTSYHACIIFIYCKHLFISMVCHHQKLRDCWLQGYLSQ